MHPHLDGIALLLGNGQQFQGVAQLSGVAKIPARQSAYSLAVDVVGVNPSVEGQSRQNGELVGGVVPLYVGGRVGLGVAQALGLGEGGVKVQALGGHLAKNVLGGAVDDGEERRDIVGQQALAEGGDEGNPPADASFVQDAGA